MGTRELSAWGGWCTSQLSIVLLGGRNSGKNSVGNLILGKEEFVTKERTTCSRRLGMVAGRWLTVVDTPGWWCDFSAQDTSKLVKREIITSVSLCSPGPHVFLLTVKASSAFSERRRRAVEEHVALLGDRVWSHCVVIFTFADRFEYTQAEGCVERGGEALRWLSEKCGQRVHSLVLNEDTEVKELLVKIQKLVAEYGNRVFEIQENVLQATAEEKRGVEERAQLRFLRMKQYRSLMRENLRPVTNVRIVLLGAKGSGKSSAFNTILARESSQGLRRTAQCQVGEGAVFGRQVAVVDTPGWWMNYFCDESSLFDRREMVLSLSLCPPGPHVFLLVIRVDRAFTETYRRAAQEHLELISEHIWSRVILLFSVGDWLGGTMTEQYIESEGEPLRWLAEKCGNRYHVLNNKTKGDGFQVRELIGKIEEMMTGCDGWHYEIERKVSEELGRRMREEAERARERQMKKEKQRQMARSQLEKLNPLPQMRVILIGGRKVGKSSCGNTILSRKSFDTDTRNTSCTEKQATITGKKVAVVDTPGCFPVTSDLLTTTSAFLIVVNISSSFKEVHREATEKQLEAGGGQLWSRAMVLFSYGDWLGDTSIEQRIEGEGEPLQRLVEQCGNRYHVLDNKNWGDGAQVRELVELVEEMLVGERMSDLHKGDRIWKSVRSAQEQHPDATQCQKGLKEQMSSRHQLHRDLPKSATSMPNGSLTCLEGSDSAQVVALPAGRARRRAGFTFMDRDIFMSYITSVLSAKQGLRWQTEDLPIRFPAPQTHQQLSTDNHMLSPRHQTMLLVSCPAQHMAPSEEDVISVQSLCHPALRERTIQRLSESGGLQALIDQWGNRSLEELESFIDYYFEMVWEQTMGSFQPSEPDHTTTEQDTVFRKVGEEEVLLSIDKKLSKLEVLEEIRSNLAELRLNMEGSWRAIQELRDKSRNDSNNTC
ncbi:uncharacterized protein LOC142371878 [Odontesthes bonariensis]|uniref:uncharacterized protein LOC142371878 n=1 Tax=Odontesthes bonariensis TaxID=219752 RepID=UPI003F582544